MAYVYFNPNPIKNQRVGDCVVRAISKVMGCNWETAYIGLSAEGMSLYDMPSANYVWGTYLQKNFFRQHMVESTCPNCITVEEFAKKHPNGTYVVATENHVVAVENGNWYDTWDSGSEIVLFYWEKEI